MITTVIGENHLLKDKLSRNVFSVFTKEVDIRAEWTEELFSDIVYSRYTVEDFSFEDDTIFHRIEKYFLTTVIPHKIAVFAAGIRLMSQGWFEDLSLNKSHYLDNLWLHDISKFSVNESIGYAFHDFGSRNEDMAFEVAWHHHKMHNEHHPEYWLNPNRTGTLEPIPMERIFIVEMLADWIGAGEIYGKTLSRWLPENIGKFQFHPETAFQVSRILNELDQEYVLPYKIIIEDNYRLSLQL